MNRRLTFSRVGRTAFGLILLGALAVTATPATAADHTDGAAVKLTANVDADINDVYAFMDGNSIVLAMTMHPFATTTTQFSDAVQYVFHVNKHPDFGGAVAGSSTVICEFDAAQNISCWFGADDYVSGDASATAGIVSDGGMATVFAGRRQDPFFFYLTGFNAARATVLSAVTAGALLNLNGCPILTSGQGAQLVDDLTTTVQTDNDFDLANTLAIVIKADKALFTDTTNSVFSVYGSTHTKP